MVGVVEHKISIQDLFGQYVDVIKLGIDKGLVEVLTLDQVEAEHLDKVVVEF